MVLYATKRIGDAASLTKSLLLPFSVMLWLKLALLAFFVGGGGGFPGGGFQSFSGGSPSPGGGPTTVQPPENILFIVAAIVVVALAIGLVLGLAGAIAEFVFVRSLREQSVQIREGFRRYLRPGARLFGFRIALGLVSLLLVGGVTVALFWSEISALLAGDPITVNGASIFIRFFGVIIVAAIASLPFVFVLGFTAEFVVPIMLKKGCGVLDGWGRLWSTIRGQPKQYIVYIFISLILRALTGFVVGILLFILGLVIGIPFLLVGIFVAVALPPGTSVVGALLLGAIAVVGVVVFVSLVSVIQVPVVAFHRYFALLFLGDVEPDFDVLGDLRPPLEADDSDDADDEPDAAPA